MYIYIYTHIYMCTYIYIHMYVCTNLGLNRLPRPRSPGVPLGVFPGRSELYSHYTGLDD